MPRNRRLMTFVDGTNLLVRLKNHYREDLNAHKPTFEILEMCRQLIMGVKSTSTLVRENIFIRDYWFFSYEGNEETLRNYKENLRKLNFGNQYLRSPLDSTFFVFELYLGDSE